MRCQRTVKLARVEKGHFRLKQHLAVYGNVHIIRAHCYICGRFALVVDGELQCCGRLINAEPSEIRRMSEPEARRKTPSAARKREILEAQNYRCLYCDISLTGYAFYRGQLKQVRLTWDHMAPYAYTLNSRAENFAATCQFCNSWKSSLIFKTVDEVRVYVEAKWQAEGTSTRRLRELQDPIPGEAQVAKVLQPALPVQSVEPKAPSRKKRPRKRRLRRRLRKKVCERCGAKQHIPWKGKNGGFICWTGKVI